MKKEKKFFTVYQIKNLVDGKIYVGAHSTNKLNDNYWGSSRYLTEDIKKIGKSNFEKRILYVFDNVEDMKNMEAQIVTKEFCMNPDTYNRIVGGLESFSTIGMVTVKDKKGKTMKVYCDDPRYLSGELVGCTKGTSHPNRSLLNKGTVVVKDKDGNSFRVSVNDERYTSGELKFGGNIIPPNWKGRQHSNDTKDKMKQIAFGRTGKKNSMYGKKRTEEFKNGVRKKLAIKFLVYDKEGNFVSEEVGIKEYADKNGLNSSSIVKVLKGKYEQTGGLKFVYA